jgi:hypothetical protein
VLRDGMKSAVKNESTLLYAAIQFTVTLAVRSESPWEIVA